MDLALFVGGLASRLRDSEDDGDGVTTGSGNIDAGAGDTENNTRSDKGSEERTELA